VAVPSSGIQARSFGTSRMDDLLKAFQAEISQELDTCDADVERLRRSPADAAALANLHRRLCSIREMSVVLGQRGLSELASRGVGALEVAQGGEVGAVAKTVPIVGECVTQIRAAVRALEPADEAALPSRARRPAEAESSPEAQFPNRLAAIPSHVSPPRKRGSGEADGAAALDSRFRRNDNVKDDGKALTAKPARAGRRRWYRPRNILLAGGSTIAAAAAAVVLVLFSVDPNDYRGVFESTLQSATGRDVTIGRIEFAVSLSPTIVLEDVTLANADWGSRPQMVAADRVEVQLALLPLVRGEFRGKRFVLHGADILLETDTAGLGNWDLDVADGDAPPAVSHQPTTLPQLSRLTIEDSTLFYRDGATGETEQFELARVTARPGDMASLLDVDVDAVVNGQPVSLAGSIGGLALLESAAPYPVDLAGDVAGLKVTLKGEVAQPLEGRGYSLSLAASGGSLDGLGSMLAVELPPGRPVQLTAVLDDAESAIRIHDIVAQVGRSDASGEIALRRGEPNWHVDVALAANKIDLDDFIPAESDADSGLDDPRMFPAEPLPYRWMRNIDITGRVAADHVAHGGTPMSGAMLEGSIAAGRLTIDRLHFGYAGGEVALKATGDVNPPAPLWTLQGSGRGLAGGETLAQLFGLTMISGGQADMEVNVSASGGSLRDIAETLAGGAGMTVTNGHINDDLMRLFLTDLTQAVSLRGGSAQLRCMTAIYDFTDGNGRARTFVADTGAAVVNGVGDVSLRSETIDMTFEPAAKDVSLAALAVPVHVTGPLGSPDVTPDPVRATANVAGSAAGLATGGLAGAVLGAVGVDMALDSAPIASCAALPGSTAAAPEPGAEESQQPAAAQATPPAATQTQSATTAAPAKTTKKAARKSTTDQILDGANDVMNNVGSALGDVFSGSSSSGKPKKPQGSKRDK
jgi:uncharacterized protein involved in outer membrane biogenesis